MNKGKYLLPALVAATLVGCGSGDSSTTGDSDSAVKTATINLSVAFPEETATKSIISSDAQVVAFAYCRLPQGSHWCDATSEVVVDREEPRASITLSPGRYYFEAATFGSSTMEWADLIDYASTGGEIVEGPNSVVMTFLQGDWTFETDTGAADPLTLADGTVLSGFKLYSGASSYSDDPMVQTAANPSKAAFDTTLPVGGWAEYGIALKTSAAELDAGWLEVFSQFHSGNDNNTTLDGFHWNLSKGCDDDECGIDPGDRFVTMLGAELYGMYEDDPESLLPDESLVDADGNDPIGETDLDSTPVDGVTIVTDIAEFRLQSTGKTLVDTTATAAKAVAANLPRSRGAAIELAAAQQAGTETGSKSVSTTELGTLTSAWYETVIVASGDGSDRGTWNFDESVYNPDTGQYEEVVDGCLEETSDGTVYASCGWLESVWDDASGTYISDPGEFSWGFEPADPNDLGEYCDYSTGYWDDVTNEYVCGEPVAPYAPWNFEDLNGDGSIDYGSFQFTHYMQYEEVIEEVRVHRLTAKGVELPVTEVVLQ